MIQNDGPLFTPSIAAAIWVLTENQEETDRLRTALTADSGEESHCGRFGPNDPAPLDVRTMTVDRRAGVMFDNDLPSPKEHSAWFMWKLMTAWIAMGFRAPKVEYVKGALYGGHVGEN